MALIELQRIGSVALLTLNRPEKYNAFNGEMSFALQNMLDTCGEDDTIRCICITGAGKAFSAGQDLEEVIAPGGPDTSTILSKHYNPIILKIRNLEKPVVAAVNGVAAGAGANIALCCDIVLAAEGASFIQAFTKIGLVPDSGGSFFLPRLMGFQKALALCLTGDKLSAADAERYGLVYAVLQDAQFLEEALKKCTQLANMPTRALAFTKQAFNKSMNNSLEDQLQLEAILQVKAGSTSDYKEGVQAFLEKRKPEFRGK